MAAMVEMARIFPPLLLRNFQFFQFADLQSKCDVHCSKSKEGARIRCADVDSFSGQRPFGQQKSTSKKVLFTACIQFWVQV